MGERRLLQSKQKGNPAPSVSEESSEGGSASQAAETVK